MNGGKLALTRRWNDENETRWGNEVAPPLMFESVAARGEGDSTQNFAVTGLVNRKEILLRGNRRVRVLDRVKYDQELIGIRTLITVPADR